MNHHPAGIGEEYAPIQTRFFQYSTWSYPTIELALLGDFTFYRSNRKHKFIAKIIFHESIADTVRKLSKPKYQYLFDIDPIILFHICCSGFTTIHYYHFVIHNLGYDKQLIDTYLLHGKKTGFNTLQSLIEHDQSLIEKSQSRIPALIKIEPSTDNIVYKPSIEWSSNNIVQVAVWMRINLTIALCIYYRIDWETDPRINDFLDNHIPVLNSPVCDIALYKPLGRSYYDKDRSKINVQIHYLPDKESTLDYLYRVFPHTKWSLKDYSKDDPPLECINGYTILSAVKEILNNIQQTYLKTNDRQLWEYYLCFVDLLSLNEQQLSDQSLIEHGYLKQYYPYCNRAFTYSDMPDVFWAIMRVPLEGERDTPETDLVEIIQKCLPIASQRRQLIKKANGLLTQNPHFWNLYRKLFWCMMTYSPNWNIKQLVDIKLLCEDKKRFLNMFKTTTKAHNILTPVVFIMVRLWILRIIHGIDWYKDCTKEYAKWDLFQESVNEELAYILSKYQYECDDPLHELRTDNGFSNLVFHRYKDTSLILYLHDKLDKTLRRHICLKVYQFTAHSVQESMNIRYKNKLKDYRLHANIKQNILNYLIKVPKDYRFQYMTLSALTLPQYGNIYPKSIAVYSEMIHIYNGTAKPKNMFTVIDQLPLKDFFVLYWYTSVLCVLQSIDFIVLPVTTTGQIEQAMRTRRYVVPNEIPLDDSVYDIYVCICCKKLHTLSGKNEYGHEKSIVLDTSTNQLICKGSKTNSNTTHVDGNVLADDKKVVRDIHKDIIYLPCKDNPVLKIPLKGFMLHWQPAEKKHEYYMHCPSCGSFHEYNILYWRSARQGYQCDYCYKDKYDRIHAVCCMCESPLKQKTMLEKTLQVNVLFPEQMGDNIQHLYFCRKHFTAAKGSAYRGAKKEIVFKTATEKITANNRKQATLR